MNILKKLTIIFILLNFVIIGNCFAEEGDFMLVEEVPENFEIWNELSEEEQKEAIMPMPFIVKYNSDEVESEEVNVNARLGATSYPAKYNLKDNIKLTVRNQEDTSDCWAFSVTSMLSTNIQKMGLVDHFKLFSTRHMVYTTSNIFTDGNNPKGYEKVPDVGGNAYLGMYYLTAGYGPLLEEQMPFKNNDSIEKLAVLNVNGKVQYKINDFITIPSIYKKIVNNNLVYYNGCAEDDEFYQEYSQSDVNNVRKMIKKQIINYGGISSTTYAGGTTYFNTNSLKTATSYYYNGNKLPNHAITIVGWDDNYSRDNFKSTNKPVHDGAYIILNSHGTGYYDGGYIYVSYDDFLIEQSLVGITNTSNVDYDNIYQYDELGYDMPIASNSAQLYAANVFNRKTDSNLKREYLNQVSIYVPEKSKIDIYVNSSNDSKNSSSLKLVKSCGTVEEGYHTFKLNSPIELTGNKFVVAEKITPISSSNYPVVSLEYNPYSNTGRYTKHYWNTATSEAGQSYLSLDGNSWSDLIEDYVDSNVCIKAFTTEEGKVRGIELNKTNIDLNKGDTAKLTATVKPDNATNKNVIWSSDDSTIVSVDQNGNLKALDTGETTIRVRTQDGNYEATCDVKIIEKKQEVGVTYQVHVQDIGWQSNVSNGTVSGTTGRSLRVEGLKIKLKNAPSNAKIKYQAHVENIGWQSWVSNGAMAGTSGKAYRVEGIKIKLENMPGYVVQYRAHVENIGWQDWVSDGTIAGTMGKSLKIEAIQIRLLKETSMVTYQAHVENIGWQSWVLNGATAGTSGKAYRVEGLKIKLKDAPSNAKITYQAHVENIGWQSWVSNGAMAGTSGKALRVEGIKIKLENMPGYVVQYRGHVQNIGWQPWVFDGAMAGTFGRSLRVEAIQIKVLQIVK